MNDAAISTYWQAFLATLPEDAPARTATYTAEPFGDNPVLADELGALVVEGKKTATCSALWEWEAEGNPVTMSRLLLDRPGRVRRTAVHRRSSRSGLPPL